MPTFTTLVCTLALILALTSATPLSAPGKGFAFVPAPGPIPYSNPNHGGDWPEGTTVRYSGGLPTDEVTQAIFAQCLQDYGSGRFYDSWDGNICGNLGWFKGSANDKIGTYDCYQTCAPWLMYNGAARGDVEYQCDYRKGLKGHCWMGYHRLPDNSTTTGGSVAVQKE
ncbi:MAG: hypothetical protein LQ338_006826 [Usnochroma carphineum]|nr:MAG: hypothetical protein LQ338_006826 [Usnochroma carphineum]